MEQSANESPVAVTDTVSAATGMAIDELPPLSTVIDPDALETILDAPETEPTPDVMVTFEYAGLRVFAHPGNIVDARPIRRRRETY